MGEAAAVRGIGRSILMLGTVLVGVVALPAATWADTGPTGRDFGRHVVVCAQPLGFDGHTPPVCSTGSLIGTQLTC
jgi:hypothetical protein